MALAHLTKGLAEWYVSQSKTHSMFFHVLKDNGQSNATPWFQGLGPTHAEGKHMEKENLNGT